MLLDASKVKRAGFLNEVMKGAGLHVKMFVTATPLLSPAVINSSYSFGGAVAQLGARLDGIEEVVGSNPIGSTK